MAGITATCTGMHSPRAADYRVLFPRRESPKAFENGRAAAWVPSHSPLASKSELAEPAVIMPLKDTRRPLPTARPVPLSTTLRDMDILA